MHRRPRWHRSGYAALLFVLAPIAALAWFLAHPFALLASVISATIIVKYLIPALRAQNLPRDRDWQL